MQIKSFKLNAMFANGGLTLLCLFFVGLLGTTSCRQQAGTSLLEGEVEAQAQQIDSLKAKLKKVNDAQATELNALKAANAESEKELQEILENKAAVLTQIDAVQAEFDLLKQNPPAPTDTILLANGKPVEGYIAQYENGVFTVALPDGETKKGRAASFKSIEFNTAPPSGDPQSSAESEENFL